MVIRVPAAGVSGTVQPTVHTRRKSHNSHKFLKMGKGDNVYKFPKLSGSSNYIEWSRKMKTALMTSGLWHIVDGTEKLPTLPPENSSAEVKYQASVRLQQWQTNDSKAHGRINSMCTADMELQIVDQSSAKSAWDKLKIHCSPKGWANKWFVMKRIEDTTLSSSGGTIQAFQARIQKLKEEVNGLNITMDDYFVIKTLNSLDAKFDTTLTVLRHEATKNDKLPALDDIFKTLRDAEYFLSTRL